MTPSDEIGSEVGHTSLTAIKTALLEAQELMYTVENMPRPVAASVAPEITNS
jgi:hypothetical protein